MPGVLILARNGPKPKNATIAAVAFHRGNGPVMLLVAPAGTNIFVELRRAGRREGCRCRMRCREQVGRPVKKGQGGHRAYPFKVVTGPLRCDIPLTRAAWVLFRRHTRLALFRPGVDDKVPCVTSRTFRLHHTVASDGCN
jgi:hypothetical protein